MDEMEKNEVVETPKKRKGKISITVAIVCLVIGIVAGVVCSQVNKENTTTTTVEESTTMVNGIVQYGSKVKPVVEDTTEATTASGKTNNNKDNNGNNSSNKKETTTQKETTTIPENRNITITVRYPNDALETDTLVIYVNDEEIGRVNDVVLNGDDYRFITEDLYKGDVKVKVELVDYQVQGEVIVDKKSDKGTIILPLNHAEEIDGIDD